MVRTLVRPCVLGVLLWMPALALVAQQSKIEIPPTFALQIRDIHSVAAPPSSSNSECDERGNVYFHLPILLAGSILRVSEDGRDIKPIPLPTGLGKHGEWHYSVAPDGGLYAIFSEAENHILVHLLPSGEEVSRTALSLPRYFHVHSFAVLPSGRGMFSGSVPSDETSSASNEIPFSIWLDPSGRLVGKKQLGKQFSRSTGRPDGLVAAGGPGTFFEATTSEVRVFDAGGNLLHTFPIAKPTNDSFATKLQSVAGSIAIAFAYPATAGSVEGEKKNKDEIPAAPYFGPLDETWLLVNSASGELKAFYQKPKDFVGSTVCYLGHQEFLYMTVKDGHLLFVETSE